MNAPPPGTDALPHAPIAASTSGTSATQSPPQSAEAAQPVANAPQWFDVFRAAEFLIRRAGGMMADSVFPNTCSACHLWIRGRDRLLCEDCRAELDRGDEVPYCPHCARSASPLSIFDRGCTNCLTERHWNVTAIARVGPYEGTLRSLVLRMKYHGDRRATLAVAERLAHVLALQDWIGEIDALVPVPMHPLRRWQRPVDHALELAVATSAVLRRRHVLGREIEVRQSVVRRVRYAQSQARAGSITARLANIRDAFAATGKHSPSGSCVCIVDNVITSGATLYEMSRILRKAGAKTIYAATLGRAQLPGDARTGEDAMIETQRLIDAADHP